MREVLALVVGAALLNALSPLALKFIVDELSRQRGVRQGSPLLLATLYVLSLGLARTASEVRELAFACAKQRIFRTVSERLFSHLMRLPLRFHLERQTGAISQALDNGLEGLRIVLHHLVFTYVPVTVELLTVLLVIARVVTPPLILLFCTALGCYMGVFGYSAGTITKAARRAAAARVAAAAAMTDGLLNYETVKCFVAEPLVQKRVGRELERCESEWIGFHRRYAINGLVLAGIFTIFMAGAVLYATEEVRRGRMTLGDFVLINTYMLQVVQPLEMMGYGMQGLSHGAAMLDRLLQVFREPAETGSGADVGGTGAGSLEFDGVSVSYGHARPVIRNVSFHVAGGKTLGIVGRSGAGKSTIVRLVTRLLEPESGTILLDGVPISGVALGKLRGLVAVVPQDTMLFDDTLRYNIALGRADASAGEVEEAARIARLHEFIMTLPDRYDTLVGERGVKLSGGERQRVSIARAVLKSPRIYVFDEATSSLDSKTEQEILLSLRAISRSITTLVIAHRLSTVVHADEIVFLEGGEIAECGTHHELLHQDGRYASLWRAQQHGVVAA